MLLPEDDGKPLPVSTWSQTHPLAKIALGPGPVPGVVGRIGRKTGTCARFLSSADRLQASPRVSPSFCPIHLWTHPDVAAASRPPGQQRGSVSVLPHTPWPAALPGGHWHSPVSSQPKPTSDTVFPLTPAPEPDRAGNRACGPAPQASSWPCILRPVTLAQGFC